MSETEIPKVALFTAAAAVWHRKEDLFVLGVTTIFGRSGQGHTPLVAFGTRQRAVGADVIDKSAPGGPCGSADTISAFV